MLKINKNKASPMKSILNHKIKLQKNLKNKVFKINNNSKKVIIKILRVPQVIIKIKAINSCHLRKKIQPPKENRICNKNNKYLNKKNKYKKWKKYWPRNL